MLRILLLLTLACPAAAEIRASSDASFTSFHSHTVSVGRQRVWQAVGAEIGKWWSPDHTFSGDSAHLSLKARAHGCFCESWAGNEVVHLTVLRSQPPATLVLAGGLGPLQEHAVTGVLTISLTVVEAGSRIDWTYRVSGVIDSGLTEWAAPVDEVVAEQIGRLARYLETGSP